jgi:hypothetical protein
MSDLFSGRGFADFVIGTVEPIALVKFAIAKAERLALE